MEDNKFQLGICLFDDTARMDTGWASINGLPAFRIKNHADLIEHRNTAFVTNCDYKAFKSSGLDKVSYLRRLDYFRTSLTSLASEFDMSLRDSPRHEIASKLSVIAASAVNYLQAINPKASIGYQSMADSWYAMLPFREQYLLNTDTEELTASAWQDGSAIRQKWELGAINMALNPNRVRHAQLVLSAPVPSGQMTIQNVVGQNVRIEDILASPIPLAITGDIQWKNSADAETCAIGTGGMALAPGRMREWYFLPEIMMLEPYARFNIHKIASWPTWKQLPVPEALYGVDEMDRLSLGLGLAAEAYLAALSTRKYHKTSGNFHPVEAGWLRAVDRAISFAAAKRLIESGVKVTRYGYGKVHCSAMKEEINGVMDIAAECGFYSASVFGSKEDE